MNSRAAAFAILEVVVLTALSCVYTWWWTPTVVTWETMWRVITQGLAPITCVVSIFYYADLYDLRTVRNLPRLGARLLRALSIATICAALLPMAFPQLRPDLHNFPSGIDGAMLAILAAMVMRGFLYGVARTNILGERVLVLGAGPLAWKIVGDLAAASPVAYQVVGFVSEGETPYTKFAGSQRPVLGSLDQLERIIADVRPDRIIVALTERRGRLPVRALLDARMRGILVEDGVEVHERLSGKLAIESLSPSFLIFSKDFKKSRLQQTLQRAVSSVAALLGLVLFSPLMTLLAYVITRDSSGPIFFIQERAGIGGRAFHLVKFRTMHPEANTSSAWELDNRYRITRVGKWLRRFRLDELPQFINVLRGDMNLVGPRPHPISNYQFFLEKIPYYSLRATVRPGITGWAQVCYAYANNLEEETEKMRYDLFYIKNLSLWLDLRILVGTIKTVLFGNSDENTVDKPADAAQRVTRQTPMGSKQKGPGEGKPTVVSSPASATT